MTDAMQLGYLLEIPVLTASFSQPLTSFSGAPQRGGHILTGFPTSRDTLLERAAWAYRQSLTTKLAARHPRQAS